MTSTLSAPSAASSAWRSWLRPRCSSTRWLAAVSVEHLADLVAAQAVDVAQRHDGALARRHLRRARCGSGRAARRRRGASRRPRPSARAASSRPRRVEARAVDGGRRVGRPATLRASRAPAVRARLTRIASSQVRSDERPSKRSMPRSTPSQVSWTTSSATARLETNVEARRSMASWWPATRATNAASSPARRRSSSRASSSTDARLRRSRLARGRRSLASPCGAAERRRARQARAPAIRGRSGRGDPLAADRVGTVTEPISVSAPPAPTGNSSTMPLLPVWT